MYLSKEKINEYLDNNNLIIRPLLSRDSQVNNISVDLRLGCDFLVSIQGRDSLIDASYENGKHGNINNFFQETRRQLGDTFILHPGQTVLAVSLEYLKIPKDVLGIISLRSSYARLGLSISSSLEPGYCGCISLELTNGSKNPIKLTVGVCLLQIRFAQVTHEQEYYSRRRKYLCQVRPQVSNLYSDDDLQKLKNISDDNNKRIVTA